MIDLAIWHGVIIQDHSFHWIAVGVLYFIGGIAAAIVTKHPDKPQEYPAWFWTTSIVVSGAILIRVSAGRYYGPPVTMYADYAVLIAAILIFAVLFGVAHIYASNREAIDKALREVKDD